MISTTEIGKVGQTKKPYGFKGELQLVFINPEYAELDTEFYFLNIEGIPVPFFIEEMTLTTDVKARLKFEDVDNETIASRYVNLEVYLPATMLKEVPTILAVNWHQFIGYSVENQHGENLGTIREVDDSTMNVLFIVQLGKKELLIPATEDFISVVDKKKKIIGMVLPEGLFDH